MADADDIDEEVGLLKPDDVLDGRYRIEKELGRGGIGVVYRAFDLELQTFVAIKMLLPKWAKDRKMVARFLREGRLAIRARHAYIVSILAINRQQGTGTPYIVMEFIEGTVLLDRLKAARDRGLPIGLAILPIIKQLASVLAACHAQKIVHRDLKPANVILVPDEHVTGGERVKLVDFGIAKMFSDEEDGTQTSVGDQQPGTPSYMAPEQCSTLDKDADPAKMDVYALGVMLYQGLVGRLPLYSPNRIGMIALLLHSQPEPLLKFDPSLPAELAQLVHDMLSKDPTKRPTMDQVRQRLNSGTEVISVRSTIEINALVPAPASEGSLAQTTDAPQLGIVRLQQWHAAGSAASERYGAGGLSDSCGFLRSCARSSSMGRSSAFSSGMRTAALLRMP
jgi:serine/threonine-protein kinase